MHVDSITKAFQWDLARQVERLEFLLKWLPRYAEWGYQELYLHLEDAVEYPSLPGVARSDAYSYRQIGRLVDAATRAGIKVVPIVNLLGHTQYLIKVPELRDLNELRDAEGRPLDRGQICPLDPRTLEVARKLLGDMAPFCTAGKVHVGLDESFHLGQCSRCRAEVKRRGLAAHFAGYVVQLHRLTVGMGLRMGLWADMLALLPEAIPMLPRDVIAYDWYYYPFARHPRIELRNFDEVNIAAPLKKQGIEYWGCPMNGAFRYEPMPVFGDRLANIRSWWKRCQSVGAGGFLVTSWEANRLAIELTTAVDAAAACLWLEPEIEDAREMLARGFARVFSGKPNQIFGRKLERTALRSAVGSLALAATSKPMLLPVQGGTRPGVGAEWRRLSRIALAGDDYAFAGYHRWQINDRWDICAGRDGVAPYEGEAKELAKICRLFSPDICFNKRPFPQSALADSADGKDRRTDRRFCSARPAVAPYRLWQETCEVKPGTCPPALRASLAFRLYLARRDVFVRRSAQAVFQLRRMLIDAVAASASKQAVNPDPLAGARGYIARHKAEAALFSAELRLGRAAAREMWNRSRNPRQCGPNELMLDRDSERLREWIAWLRKAGKNPELIWQATPVCGAWQLQFTVHNFAPALQKVVVEQLQPNGSWQTLHGLYTIEFRAAAAKPRTNICREFSVPIPGAASASRENAERLNAEGLNPKVRLATSRPPGFPVPFARLRIAVRGVGQVGISNVELTNGVEVCEARGFRNRKLLGSSAPSRGMPSMDWTRNCGELELLFRRAASAIQVSARRPVRQAHRKQAQDDPERRRMGQGPEPF